MKFQLSKLLHLSRIGFVAIRYSFAYRGGIYLFVSSSMVSLRRLPHAVKALRSGDDVGKGQITSAQALASVVAATIGFG